MNSIKLYLLTRIKNINDNTSFENVLSGRTEVLRIKDYEFACIKELVELLLSHKISIDELEGFYYSYTIKQIGKQFDL